MTPVKAQFVENILFQHVLCVQIKEMNLIVNRYDFIRKEKYYNMLLYLYECISLLLLLFFFFFVNFFPYINIKDDLFLFIN